MAPVLSCLLLVCVTGFVVAAPAAEIAVQVTRDGEVFQVDASASIESGVEGGVARTWRVLTDYGRFAEFIPDLHSSRVVSRDGQQVVVEQKGEARVLFFSFPIDVRIAITEHPHERLVSHAVGGNFRELRSAYSLEAGQGRVLLRYTGRMVPDFFVPPLIGTLALRHNVETSFRALVAEIERQHRKPVTGER
jgi:hypothetical protein